MTAYRETMSRRIAELDDELSGERAENEALRQILRETEDERDAALRQVRRMMSDRTYVVAA